MQSMSSSNPPLKSPTEAAKRWLELRRLRQSLATELEHLEQNYGFRDTKYVDHYDGTNMSEYVCLKCGENWLLGITIPCPKCHPEFYQAIRNERI